MKEKATMTSDTTSVLMFTLVTTSGIVPDESVPKYLTKSARYIGIHCASVCVAATAQQGGWRERTSASQQ